MALKPTIYKFTIFLSDLERNYYDTLNLTVALHPSETVERMVARLLAYCINASPELNFTRGLSANDEPDLWAHTLDNRLSLWIDVGEPAPERIIKATRLAEAVRVYSFNTRSATWWDQSGARLQKAGASVFRFDWAAITGLAGDIKRTMSLSITVEQEAAYLTLESSEHQVIWTQLC